MELITLHAEKKKDGTYFFDEKGILKGKIPIHQPQPSRNTKTITLNCWKWAVKWKSKNLSNTYLYKILDRATSNHLFENNIIGNYEITPQHGVNVYVFHLYKYNKGFYPDAPKTHFLTVNISNGIFAEITQEITKKERKTIEQFFLNVYKGKALIIKEFLV